PYDSSVRPPPVTALLPYPPLFRSDDVEHAVLVVHAPRRGVRRVALGGHPLVPVVVRRGRVLHFHRLEPRVLARWLVEVPVNDDRDRKSTRLNSSHEWISYAVFSMN